MQTSDAVRGDDCCVPAAAAFLTEPGLASDILVMQLKAMAHPVRIKLLGIISSSASGESCVCDLPGPLGVGQSTVSHHLKILVDAGLLLREQRGKWAYFRPVPEAINGIREQLAPFGA